MTSKPQLRLVRHPPSRPEHTPLHADIDREKLWDTVRDHALTAILRESALLELAHRHDPDLFSFCDALLSSLSPEDWILSVKTLAAFGTSDALEKLVMIFASTINMDDRLFLLNLVARTLTAEYVHPFSIMLRDIVESGEVDITGWTKVAIATLQDVCRRKSISVCTDGVPLDSDGQMSDGMIEYIP